MLGFNWVFLVSETLLYTVWAAVWVTAYGLWRHAHRHRRQRRAKSAPRLPGSVLSNYVLRKLLTLQFEKVDFLQTCEIRLVRNPLSWNVDVFNHSRMCLQNIPRKSHWMQFPLF